jgi:hypothetical protein
VESNGANVIDQTPTKKLEASRRRHPVDVRFTPESGHRTSAERFGMSALCQKLP